MDFCAPKGVFDILPVSRDKKDRWTESSIWRQVEKLAGEKSALYGFSEIRTPALEKTELFFSLGEFSDIVKKETYTFPDRKGRSLTLRPEGTAPVIRAFLEHKLYERCKESKFFYILPMFRYERQQAGRYRQHHQFGAESIGIRHPYRDIEIIYLLWDFYNSLGLEGLVLHINSLGSGLTRRSYEEELKFFFKKHHHDLSPVSQERYDHGHVLRILDSKEEEDQLLIAEAPVLRDFLDEESSLYFSAVLELLKDRNITYRVNDRLVRGLDYYTDMIFEVTAPIRAAHNSIGGGGRYDGLISKMGGPDLPACGFGTGIERIIQTLLEQDKDIFFDKPNLRILPLDISFEKFSIELVSDLREKEILTDIDLTRRDLRTMLKSAAFEDIAYVIIVGETEVERDRFVVKNMRTRSERVFSRKELKERLIINEI